MKQLKLNQKGFSLVELMVVVAIIGILATIGIPQYQKFMAKARQSEAKTYLNSIFQGEASHFTEYNTYTANIKNIGGGAVGKGLRYNAGFDDTAVASCAGASPLTPAAAAATDDFISVSTGNASWYVVTTFTDSIKDAAITDCKTLATTYLAGAWGNPTNSNDAGNNNKDQFTIDQNREIKQVAVGL